MTPRGSWVTDPQPNSLGQSLGMPVDQCDQPEKAEGDK